MGNSAVARFVKLRGKTPMSLKLEAKKSDVVINMELFLNVY